MALLSVAFGCYARREVIGWLLLAVVVRGCIRVCMNVCCVGAFSCVCAIWLRLCAWSVCGVDYGSISAVI